MVSVTKNIVSADSVSDVCADMESADWIWHPDLPRQQPGFVEFSIDFIADASSLVFHVSADQRFKLNLDGEAVARGPDCSDPEHWPFATYEVALSPGEHRLSAIVWWIGQHAPVARMTVEGGFILKARDTYHEKLTTGIAPWKVCVLPEYSFSPWKIKDYQSVGDQVLIDGRRRGATAAVGAAVIAPAGHKTIHGLYYDRWRLRPTTLPDQLSAARSLGRVRAASDTALKRETRIGHDALRHPRICACQLMIDGQDGSDIAITPNTVLSVLCDLGDYFCAYPRLCVSGGRDTRITWAWAEALYHEDLASKSANRDAVEGLYFTGIEDAFIANGNERQEYETHWWRAGRYILLTFATGDEALIVHSANIEETRYPLENEGPFNCDDPDIAKFTQICFRGLQTHSHEIATDSPYYEQMMYTGDNRLQALLRYVTSGDDRLTRQCIRLFNWSRARGCEGLTTARYPDRSRQWIPGFSLIWVWMVHDYYYWRNDHAFIAEQLPATRSVCQAFTSHLNDDHLLEAIPYWTFVDWTDDWNEGYPPGARGGISSLLNLQYVMTLDRVIELESSVGSEDMADVYRKQRDRTVSAIVDRFWNDDRGLFADDIDHRHFSEHAQALAIACATIDQGMKERAVQPLRRESADLTKASIYFTFYVFEALRIMNAADDGFSARLAPWQELGRNGFKTPPEVFGNSRSDCHAWGSHPLYHLHTTVLGVRPALPHFSSVSVEPHFVGWENMSGSIPHPAGTILTSFAFSDDRLTGSIVLPPGVPGQLKWKGTAQDLSPGVNEVAVFA